MNSSNQGKRHSLLQHFRQSKLFGVADIILIAALIVIAIVSVIFSFAANPKGKSAEVYINGKLAGAYSLNQDKTVTYDVGVVLHIDNGSVKVTQSDCPDHICENIGYISKAGQRIICAPNKFVVVIRGESDGYDAVTGRNPL